MKMVSHEDVTEKVDSINHVPIKKDIALIRSTNDSTRSDVKVILSIIKVMATNDQLIKAKEEREGAVWK